MEIITGFDKERPYTARRVDLNKDTEVATKISEYFNEPDKYFELNSNIIIGKPIKGPRYNDQNKPIPFTYVGGKEQFNQGRNEQDRNSLQYSLSSLQRGKRNSKPKPPVNYDIVDDRRLNSIFKDAKARIASNGVHLNDFMKNAKIDNTLKDKFKQQEKILKNNEKERCRTAELSKNLAKRINKKDDEMLIYRNDAHNAKKQILDFIENERPLVEKYGEYYWMMDLKRPKVSSRIRTAYINVAPRTNNLLFDDVKEFPKRAVELTHRPMSPGIKHIDNFVKDFAGAIKKNKINVNQIKNMAQLELCGKNLLEDELKRASKTSGMKLIYKEPKDTGMNEIYKENYDGRVYLKNKLFGIK
jgi:hypothetical protein